MKFENWCAILTSLFFALSALTMGFAQIKTSSATDLIIDSIIGYENSRIISDEEVKMMILETDRWIIQTSTQVNTNYACLGAILAERTEPFNRTLYGELLYHCIPQNFSIETIDFGTIENFNPSEPISSFNDKLNKIGNLRIWAIWLQGSSVIFFTLGVACLIFLIKKKVLDFSNKRRTSRDGR